MQANAGSAAIIASMSIDDLEVDRLNNDLDGSIASSLIRNDTNESISDDDEDEVSLGSPLSAQNNNNINGGTIRTSGWIHHTTSSNKNPNHTPSTSFISSKKTKSKRRPRYFVLRENTISYYSRPHHVKAKGTFVLTSGCTVGPVVFASLDEPLSTDDDQHQQQERQDGKAKKKKRQYYCVQVTWPKNSKASKDEKIIAKAKARVAAEREKEAQVVVTPSRSTSFETDEAANLSKSTTSFTSPLSRSKQFLGTIRSPKSSLRKSKSSDEMNNIDEDDLPPPPPSPPLLQDRDDEDVMARTRKDHQEQQQQTQAMDGNINSPSLNHETGLHKHYSQQLKKHAKNQQQSQEELQRVALLLSRHAKNEKSKKRVVLGAKVAAVSGAAITAGVLTAGIGFAAGLVFVGITAAAGGSGAVVGGKVYGKAKGKYYERVNQKSFHLILGANTHEEAMKWKIALEQVIKELATNEDDSASWRLDAVLSSEEGQAPSVASPERKTPTTNGIKASADGNNSTFHVPSSRWEPIQGGGLALSGALSGGGNLRVYREEGSPWYLEEQTNSAFPTIPRFRSDIGVAGQTFPPHKASLVLKAKSLDAFMSLMCSGRINDDGPTAVPVPNSGQIASFRIIDTINDHLDVIHLVFRPLYLFPSWTAPRDFVLYRFWKHDDDGSYHIYFDSVEHDGCPPLPEYVRGKMHSVYTIAPLKQSKGRKTGSATSLPDYNKECLLSQVVQVEPRGWVPTRFSFLRNQGYGDAFAVMALNQMLDVQEALDTRRFVAVQNSFSETSEKRQRGIERKRLFEDKPTIDQLGTMDSGEISDEEEIEEGDYEFQQTDLVNCAPITSTEIALNPPPTTLDFWAEPDANSFRVRGKKYLKDKHKYNAGPSLFRLFAADIVEVDVPIMGGMCPHPTERVQLALERERVAKEQGLPSDMPPYVFCVNIVMPGPPHYHMVFYYAVDDMSKIDGSDGTPSSKLCQEFFFGGDDTFRDSTFKLIPCVVEGNFMVRKAVGSTPAIMGKKIKQTYFQDERFFEIMIDTGSSAVGAGVIGICIGYAKMLVADLAFLFEGYDESTLPEKVLGTIRVNHVVFDKKLRFVENPYV